MGRPLPPGPGSPSDFSLRLPATRTRRSSRIRPANDRETSRNDGNGWSIESAGQEPDSGIAAGSEIGSENTLKVETRVRTPLGLRSKAAGQRPYLCLRSAARGSTRAARSRTRWRCERIRRDGVSLAQCNHRTGWLQIAGVRAASLLAFPIQALTPPAVRREVLDWTRRGELDWTRRGEEDSPTASAEDLELVMEHDGLKIQLIEAAADEHAEQPAQNRYRMDQSIWAV